MLGECLRSDGVEGRVEKDGIETGTWCMSDELSRGWFEREGKGTGRERRVNLLEENEGNPGSCTVDMLSITIESRENHESCKHDRENETADPCDILASWGAVGNGEDLHIVFLRDHLSETPTRLMI